jgi:hypothetical protein
MLARLTLVLLLVAGIPGCVVYEYEHEFFLRTDGSGSVYVSGRPELWTAFKGLGDPRSPRDTATRGAARELFERAGLRVRRVIVSHRGGRPYLFVSADFADVATLARSGAFPDLQISVRPEGDQNLRLSGRWAPPALPRPPQLETDGLVAVRFHLPSKVYSHDNAVLGVERGNIVTWRESVADALGGRPLAYGALVDRRSILFSTVALFAGACLLALAIIAGGIWMTVRRGRHAAAAEARSTRPAAG